jgi:hypothetical protein
MLTRLVALAAASVLLASSIAVAAPSVPLMSDDQQVETQGQAPVYVPNPEDYHRFDHQN